MKIGIIGHGTVGKGVESGFSIGGHDIVLVDVKYGRTSAADIFSTDVVFICLPTKTADNSLESTNVLEVCNQLKQAKYKGLVIIKSSLAPAVLDLRQWINARKELRLVINPDFATTPHTNRDFIESPMIVLGADDPETLLAAKAVYNQSIVRKKWFMEMSINEALLMNLFVNTFVATKLAVMNEFRQMHAEFSNRPWDEFAHMMAHDPRIGRTGTQPHGPNGTYGFDNGEFAPSMNTFTRVAKRLNVPCDTVAGAMISNSLSKK